MSKMIKDKTSKGFTLIEMLVVVLIIGILAAVAVPMYQRSVLRTHFNSLMPVAKAVFENNEVYYLAQGNYAKNIEELSVSTADLEEQNFPNGTGVVLNDKNGLSYVLVGNTNIPNARYVMFQKQSENFPDTTWCEAHDEKAEELCVSLGGQENDNTREANWKSYLLTGVLRSGDSFSNIPKYVSPRTLSGDPQCNTYANGNSYCEYTYTSGEKLKVWRNATGTPRVSCDSNNLCSVGSSSTGDGVIQATLQNGTASDNIYFDDEGNLVGVLLNTTEGIFVFDAAGNIKTLSMGQNSAYNAGSLNAKYDENGNVRYLNLNFKAYYYDENGNALSSNAPVQNVSQYKLTQEQMNQIVADVSQKVQDYSQYNVCDLFPESCQD